MQLSELQAQYIVISGIVSFILSYWFIPSSQSKSSNLIGSLYMLGCGFLLWPLILAAAIRVNLHKKGNKNE